MSKKILVTGGAGYIGSACVKTLVEAGNTVVVFDDLTAGQEDKVTRGASLIVGDVTNETAVDEVFSQYQFDTVIHLAAKKAVGESEQEPALYFKNNVLGTLNVLSAMARYTVPQIIFSSTASVYAPIEGQATETSPVDPKNVYGQSKLMSETLIREFTRTGKISSHAILRYFNVAGDSGLGYKEESAQNVFPLIARSIKGGKSFQVFGDDYETKDGSGVRDYIHLSDLAEAHGQATNTEGACTINLGTGVGYSVFELVAAFEKAIGRKIEITVVPRRAGDVATVVANAERAKEILGWEPKRTLTDMVESTVAVYGL